MCGINGIAYVESSGLTVEPDLLVRMRDVLYHRGPDESGIFVERNVGLGHRRLSIVDLKNGHQPMRTEDGKLVITYNGEIYNHAQRRSELESRGHRYSTNCDTETILHLYQEYGNECVHKLRGMFALAIWDTDRRELFVARDRLGVKPLYYVHDAEGNFFFASEIKALLSAQAVKPELNYQVLSDYLANHAPSGEETLFTNVKRLPPGHTLIWKNGQIAIQKYWDIEFDPKLDGSTKSTQNWVVEWKDRFKEAVKMRLMADVPLGMFLSGGIDSSAIAAVMSEYVDGPINTFSVAFAERDANELQYARLVAEKFKTEHHEVIVSPDEFFGSLSNLIWHEDEPMAHPSSVALNFVSRLAGGHVKVVLTGEGSDESLAGYGRYAKTLLNLKLGHTYQKLAPEFARSIVAAGINTLPAGSTAKHKLRKSFFSLPPTIDSIYFDNFAVFSRRWQEKLLTSQAKDRMRDHRDPYREMNAFFESAGTNSLLDRMLYADTKTYLHELLMKQDQMSMAASIESRVPFLDHELMEFAARMPDKLKLNGRVTKYVLREAMKGVLPDQIITRGKMGFPVPIGKWFRTSHKNVIEEFVLSSRALERNIFDADAVRQIVKLHDQGENHDEKLWALLNFEMWHRRFIDEGH
jgi:asparagine synthase (glutamine-hydrolysing)